jgi:phenylacetaldehyde dehydrogenase
MIDELTHDISTLAPEARAFLDRPAGFYIDGQWQRASRSFATFDPATTEPLGQIGAGGVTEIDAAVRAAQKALQSAAWRDIGPMGRERLLVRLAELIEGKAQVIGQIETVDNGMPSWMAAHLNAMGAADVYRYYAGWPSKLAGQTMEVNGTPGMGKFLGMTLREPVGVVGAIIPWNVPFMMAAWKLAPALAAGCTVVLKPAEDTSLSAVVLAELLGDAGFPPGVVNIVSGTGQEAGEALVKHPGVGKISFTGSTVTGRRIGELAGRHLKKITLELGGKSPTIVFDDADLDRAVFGAATGIFLNSGQICVAGSRLYVQAPVYEEVLERLAKHLPTVNVGPGLRDGTFMGPLVSDKQRKRVISYIELAKNNGLNVLQGQAVDQAKGYYVSPTIISGAAPDHRITQEEIFGPVLSVYKFSNIDEVISAANGTEYGLAATVWSRDVDRLMTVAARLQCGKVSLNTSGFPYPGLPEGGYKASGFGRDLGYNAVEQNLQTKTVLLAL